MIRHRAINRTVRVVLVVGLLAPVGLAFAHQPGFTDSFMIEQRRFADAGVNPYFVLQPGRQLTLEGDEGKAHVRLTITVLRETRVVDGVKTRVVEQRETKNGELVEVSKNYFAICAPTNSVFYFGEDVDIYSGGVIVSHEGAWLTGRSGAKAGIVMPGVQLLGARYFQEIAPGVAMDRAETVSVTEVLSTPAGDATGVLKVEETTPLEPNAREYKLYAPGIGLVQDGALKLIEVRTP